MKNYINYLLPLMLLLIASGCGSNTENKSKEQKGRDTVAQTEPKPPSGGKWVTDSATRLHALNLQQILASDNLQTVDAYRTLSDKTSTEINALLSDCRMKGEAHEALHHWLEKFMQSNEQLKKSSGTEEAAVLLTAMREQLNLYTKTFE